MDGVGAVGGAIAAPVAAPIAAPAVTGTTPVGGEGDLGSVTPTGDTTSPSAVVSLGNGVEISFYGERGANLYQAVSNIDYLNGFVDGMMTDPYGTIAGYTYDELVLAFLLALLLKEKQ